MKREKNAFPGLITALRKAPRASDRRYAGLAVSPDGRSWVEVYGCWPDRGHWHYLPGGRYRRAQLEEILAEKRAICPLCNGTLEGR